MRVWRALPPDARTSGSPILKSSQSLESWVIGILGEKLYQHQISTGVLAALKACKAAKEKFRQAKQAVILSLGLHSTLEARDNALDDINTLVIKPLLTPYPPSFHWVVKGEPMETKWCNYLRHYKQSNSHLKQPGIFILGPKK